MAESMRPVALRGPEYASTRAGELIAQQSGPIARRQLLAVGFSSERIRSWLATGRLHPTRYRGVYAGGRPDLSEKGELVAGLLFAGHGSALAGLASLWWRGYLHGKPHPVDIDTPTRTRSYANLRIHHPGTVEREFLREIPVTPMPAALLAASRHLEHDSLRLVLARAEFDRTLSLSSLQKSLGRGIVGSAAVRAAMDAHLPQLAKCVNGPERDFVLLCEKRRLPIPEPNARIGRFRPDMLWEERRLIVELDGHRAHSTPAQLASDAKRQRWLESQGYMVLRFTHDDVRNRPDWVAARVRAALAHAS